MLRGAICVNRANCYNGRASEHINRKSCYALKNAATFFFTKHPLTPAAEREKETSGFQVHTWSVNIDGSVDRWFLGGVEELSEGKDRGKRRRANG